MNTQYNQYGCPLVWAHRGASGYAPENTMAAFEKAVELHADGIELDVQVTKDGEMVVLHDEMIDRTSDGQGWLKDYTLAQLRELDFSYQTAFPGTERMTIPTMQDVFELIRPTDLTINIELKTGIIFYSGIEERILEMTKDFGMEERVIYSSFNHYSVQKIRTLAPQARTGLLYADGIIGMPRYGRNMGVTALHPALYNLQYPGFMEEARTEGLKVNVWTVNTEEEIRMCLEMGVDAIITNYPDRPEKLLRSTAIRRRL